jgi:hypothetical protein
MNSPSDKVKLMSEIGFASRLVSRVDGVTLCITISIPENSPMRAEMQAWIDRAVGRLARECPPAFIDHPDGRECEKD